MPKGSNQKLKIMYLAQILMKNTDEEHPMAMKEIIERLNSLGVSAERKSLYSDIEALNTFGFDIESNTKGYYVASRDFELPELKMLADCVSASKFITERKSAKLIRKIESLAGKYEAGMLARQVFISDRIKQGNESIYYNVDTISEAINAGKKIAFKYFTYGVDKKKRYKNGGAEYVVSPYSLTVSDENYYLISHYPKHENLTHFRVDKMTGIRVLDENIESAQSVMGKSFSVGEYSKRVFSMYAGECEKVTLLCKNSLINAVIDRFGEDVYIEKHDEEHFSVWTSVEISPTFFAWVFTFGGKMKIKSPEKVKTQFREIAEKFLN